MLTAHIVSRELHSATLTIRLTPEQKQQVVAAGRLFYNADLPPSTLGRLLLMEEVRRILSKQERS